MSDKPDFIDIKITKDGAIEYAAKHLSSWVTMALGDEAHNLERVIKSDYLSGQALKKVTGQTYNSVQAFFFRNSVWRVRPGVGVRGNLNYLARWTGTEHEFMQPAFDRVKNQIKSILENKIQKHLQEVH